MCKFLDSHATFLTQTYKNKMPFPTVLAAMGLFSVVVLDTCGLSEVESQWLFRALSMWPLVGCGGNHNSSLHPQLEAKWKASGLGAL